MRAMYLDNFRGFSNQVIPLLNMNFLVGENSTGKTSFLSVVKVLGNARFWMRPSFDDADLPFSTFSEIVSRNSSKKCFTIGYFNDEKPKGEDANLFKLIQFKDSNGFPVVHKYVFLSTFGLVFVVIGQETLHYKIAEAVPDSDIDVLVGKASLEFAANDLGSYVRVSTPHFSRSMIFAYSDQIIAADLAGKWRGGDSSISFNINVDGPICKWIAPIRARPEKIYLGGMPEYSSEGAHIPFLLSNMFKAKPNTAARKNLNAMNVFGRASGLFDEIKIKRFGKERVAPFEVNVELGGNSLRIGNVGYGVSQVLPVILEARRQTGYAFTAIQQPEVHLHPKAQAALGEFLYECNMNEKAQFLVETHSDYIIDRFRLCMKKGKVICEAQVLFFERTEQGNTVHLLEIDPEGRYPEEQPSSFREFFLNEELSMLRL